MASTRRTPADPTAAPAAPATEATTTSTATGPVAPTTATEAVTTANEPITGEGTAAAASVARTPEGALPAANTPAAAPTSAPAVMAATQPGVVTPSAPAVTAVGGFAGVAAGVGDDATLDIRKAVDDAGAASTVTIKQPVYEVFKDPRSERTGRRLLFHKGQVVPRAEIDRIADAQTRLAAERASQEETGPVATETK